MKPYLLDICCCAGGAAKGYSRAGFEVGGIDKYAQPNHPYPFLQADGIEALDALIDGQALHFAKGDEAYWLTLEEIDAIHVSPPCQGYCTQNSSYDHPKLIPDFRERLVHIDKPYIIENVPNSPMRSDLNLCGEMFGLRVIRHRWFELGGWVADKPEHKPHRGELGGYYYAVYGHGGGRGSVRDWQRAMGITWTSIRREISEAIPPAYTEYIGNQLLSTDLFAKAA